MLSIGINGNGDDLLFLAIFGIIWHVFAIGNMLLLAPYNRKWEGFYLGLLLGPIGSLIALAMRDGLRDKVERGEAI